MRSFIDTNIFVYATCPKFPQFSKARDFLNACIKSSDLWYLSWNVVYEYLRVVTHPQIFPEGALSFSLALENVLKFSQSPCVEILQETDEHPKYLTNLGHEISILKGNLVHDAHHVILMREHDIHCIYTADSDLHRFKGLKVVNPL